MSRVLGGSLNMRSFVNERFHAIAVGARFVSRLVKDWDRWLSSLMRFHLVKKKQTFSCYAWRAIAMPSRSYPSPSRKLLDASRRQTMHERRGGRSSRTFTRMNGVAVGLLEVRNVIRERTARGVPQCAEAFRTCAYPHA